MEQQIFCDGIGRISIIGGVVRLDLMAYSPTETDANGEPRAVLTHRVVMGVDGFLRSSEKVLDITRQITSKTAPKAAKPEPAPSPAAPPSTAPPPPAPQLRRETIRPEPPPAPAAPPPPPRQPFP